MQKKIENLRLFNSLDYKIDKFVPLNKKKVIIYLCGPTVYSEIHIGNARTIILTDVIVKILIYTLNYNVLYFQNITDISEKIVNALIDSKYKSEKEIVDVFTKKYIKALNDLNIKMPNEIISASKTISDAKNITLELLKKNKAYKISSGIYVNCESISDYGKLSQVKLDKNIAKKKNLEKKNINDFALWKFNTDGVQYDFEIGKGRPGWHIECVSIVNSISQNKNLIDIHVGGKDLMFPHHENEIAIQKLYKENNLAKFWVHIGQLQYENKKMSKSIGNIVNVDGFIKKYSANILRYCLLNNNYKKPFNLNEQFIKEAELKIKKWNIWLKDYENIFKQTNSKNNKYKNTLDAFFLDNLNFPNVFRNIHIFFKKLNVMKKTKTINKESSEIYSALLYALKVMGLDFKC